MVKLNYDKYMIIFECYLAFVYTLFGLCSPVQR